jgi:CSLREA domain-containing protein
MRVPLAALALAYVVASWPASAVTYQVNDAGDAGDATPGDNVCQTSAPGVCTLRAAIEEANATGGSPTIALPAMTVALGAPLVVTRTMTIPGSGAAVSVVSGSLLGRVITVQPSTYQSLTIRDVTLRDGMTEAHTVGGAVDVAPKGQLTMERCRLVHNTAGYGGGLFSDTDTNASLTDVEVTDNHAVLDDGGGLYAYGNMHVSGASIHDNDAVGNGGGVTAQFGAFVIITNSTIAKNTAVGGGGIYSASTAEVRLYSSTLSGNRATSGGGGGAKAEAGTATSVTNSILAYNYAGVMLLAESDFNGSLTANQSNILRHQTNGTITGTVSAADPMLGPFQDNGGRGPTFALKSGSPAIDAVAGCLGVGHVVIPTDQRGVTRVLGSGCDLGAYERAPCGDVNGDGSVNVTDVFFLINALFAGGAPPPGLANVNGDSSTDVSDIFFLINRLFAGGSAPTCPGT